MSNSLYLKIVMFSALMLALFGAASLGYGQEQLSEDEDVPPPLVALSTEELAQLSSVTDSKNRIQLCLQLAHNRLQRAEALTNEADFQKALTELGAYQAVIDNGLKFLNDQNNDSRKLRDNLKRLEMGLRAHAPRLETIRRSTPFEFSKYIKAILNFARDARSRALEGFFSDTVMSSESNSKKATEASTGATNRSIDPFSPEKKP